MDFSERLKKAAKHAGVDYSQTAIANSLGLKRKQTVDRWMEGGMPNPPTIYLIADKWKVDPRWLATGAGTEPGAAPAAQQSEAVYAVPRTGGPTEGEKLLAVIKTFLDTDAEGQLELAAAAQAVARGERGTAARQTRPRRTRRR